MSTTQIPDNMLRHLEYLRNLHIQGPRIGNIYLQDSALHEYLAGHEIGQNESFKKELTRLGQRFATIYLDSARDAQYNQPKLEQFDSYGRRIDKLHLSEGWKQLGKYSAQDGIVAMAYDGSHNLGINQRFGQLIALYMYQCSSGLYGCPLAMTDGAAYTLKDFDKTGKPYLEKAFYHLTSRNQPWTSGQWMTEKKGGSDVSNTETVAINEDKEKYRLYGYKWFTSATDSQMSLGLAKIIPKDTPITQQLLDKTKVSMFFIKMRKEDQSLNNMEIIRLKDKLGTQQLPTAELLLKGSQAFLVGKEGNGVKMISKMLTITRLYNSSTAVGIMRRGLALARDYSGRRIIGKSKLSDLPLQVRVLSNLDVTHRGNLIFFLKISELFSKEQARVITDDQANIVRVMSPILKLFTGKQVLEVITECLENFGGLGYIEGTMLPTMLRDAQVLSIWEGTTNVLCYDFVRALLKKQNKVAPFDSIIKFFLDAFEVLRNGDLRDHHLVESNKILIQNYLKFIKDLQQSLKCGFKGKQSELRTLCFGLARIFAASLLQQHACLSMRQKDFEISSRWIKRGLYIPEKFDKKLDRKIGLDLNELGEPRGVGDVDANGKPRPRL